MPYLILAGCAVAMLVAACLWKPSPTRLWVWFTTAGAISLGDLLVTGILNLYEYRPGLLAGRADNYLGVLLAELLFVPSYYTLLSAAPRRVRIWVMCLAVAPVLGLEYLFLGLGVYVHHHWHLIDTAVLFCAYSLVAALGVSSFEQHHYTRLHRFVLVGTSIYFAMNLWGLIPVGIFRLFAIHLWLLRPPELDLAVSSLLLHSFPTTVIAFWGIWTGWLRRPAPAALFAGLLAAWIILLKQLGVWQDRPPWNPLLGGIGTAVTYHLVSRLDQWFLRHAPPRVTIPPWEPPIS